jgi:hypothetical protein
MRTSELKQAIDKLDHWPIMERLLGLNEVLPGRMLKSPLRDGDKHPSFGLFRDRSKQARWKDFAMDYGDVYQLAMMLYGIQFSEAVMHVGEMVGLGGKLTPRIKVPTIALRKVVERARAICTWQIRPWEAIDHVYWHQQYGLDQAFLDQYQFFTAGWFHLRTAEGKELLYKHSPYNPMYVIKIGQHVKMYRPWHADKKFKFMGNTDRDDIFGMDQFDDTLEHLVWNAGQKDAAVSRRYLRVNTLSMNGESVLPTDKQMFAIAKRVKGEQYVLYDNDDTGQLYALKFVQRFPFVKTINLSQYTTTKDISQMVANRELNTVLQIRSLIHSNP